MKGSNFQIIVIGVIMGLVVLSVMIFAGVIPVKKLGRTGGPVVELTFWGSFPRETLTKVISAINQENKKIFSLKYIPKGETSYEQEFVDALASGEGPDLLVLSQDLILKHRGKFYTVPFEVFSERLFRDSFVDGAELFILEEGILAVPLVVDPIVLYWNRDLFAKAGLARPPKFWDEFSDYVSALTEIDQAGNIIQSGTAMGEFANVDHAKEIFSFLVLQAGNPIIQRETLELRFDERSALLPTVPAESALRFYTDFSNPLKLSYSWNRGLAQSREAFLASRLAMYFGYASESNGLQESNPHLNFDVALAPQIKDFPIQATFGKIYALAVPKASPNLATSLNAAFSLTKPQVLEQLEENLPLPPVSRSLLAHGSLDPGRAVFYKAAVQSRAWLEPDPKAVSEIFKNMIESVTTGKKSVLKAVKDTTFLLKAEINKIK